MTMLTAEQLEAIRKRADDLNEPGPWKFVQYKDFGHECFIITEAEKDKYNNKPYPRVVAQVLGGFPICEFIAHARADIPALLATVAAQRERIAELESSAASRVREVWATCPATGSEHVWGAEGSWEPPFCVKCHVPESLAAKTEDSCTECMGDENLQQCRNCEEWFCGDHIDHHYRATISGRGICRKSRAVVR